MAITREDIRKYLKKEYPHLTVTNRTLLTYFTPAHHTRFVFSRFLSNLQTGMKSSMDPLLVDALTRTNFETLGDILPFLLCMKELYPKPVVKDTPKTVSREGTWVYTPQNRWPFPTGLKD